jgi:hypothetical protein
MLIILNIVKIESPSPQPIKKIPNGIIVKNKHPIYVYLIILVLVSILNVLLSRFAVIIWEIAPGVSALYFAVAFMIPFALWFGAWGAMAAYIGCVIGAGMTGMPLTVNLYWSLADLWQVLIPLFAFKTIKADFGLSTRKGLVIFLVFGWILNNLAGAVWGSTMLAVGGVITRDTIANTFAGWFTGNLLVTIVITPILLKYVTPYVRKTGLYVREYWC